MGYYPDAVSDSPARRKVAAKRRARSWLRVQLASIAAGLSGHYALVTFDIPAGVIYDRESYCRARRMAAAFGVPALYDTESAGKLHTHVLMPVEGLPLDTPLEGVDVRHVYDPAGLLEYLSKPQDAAAARSKHEREVPAERQALASERYLQAKAAANAQGMCLPDSSGVVNVPTLTLTMFPALVFVLVLFLARLAELAEVKPRRTDSRPLPGLPVSVPRRVALVGHARPPPRRKPHPGLWLPVGAAPLASKRKETEMASHSIPHPHPAPRRPTKGRPSM